MNDLLIPILAAAVMAMPGVWGAYIALKSERRESDDSAIDAWRSIVDPLRREMAEMRDEVEALQIRAESQSKRIKALESELQRVDAGNTLLISQLRASGHEPIWTPTEVN